MPFLVLIAMFVCLTTTPQVTADFTTITSVSGCGSLAVEFTDLSLVILHHGYGTLEMVKLPLAKSSFFI